MTGDYDSRIHCPRCPSGPSLYLFAQDKGALRAQCPGCGGEYRVTRRGDGYVMEVPLMEEALLGRNSTEMLRELLLKGSLEDSSLDRESRRQLRRLEVIGLVRSCAMVTDDGKKFFWEPTRKGLLHMGDAHEHEEKHT